MNYKIISKEDIIKVNITNDNFNTDDFDGVIVIPLYNKSYVMTYHPKSNSWKFPNGNRLNNEDITECVKRVSFNETGSILNHFLPIGYLRINQEGKMNKIIFYIADVENFEPKPRCSETDVVKLFDIIPKKILNKNIIYKTILNSSVFIKTIVDL